MRSCSETGSTAPQSPGVAIANARNGAAPSAGRLCAVSTPGANIVKLTAPKSFSSSSAPGVKALRWLAEGRDASAMLDAADAGFGKNDGENEITGVHVSDGNPSARGILEAKAPTLGHDGWRWSYTQQHRDNATYEVRVGGRPSDEDHANGD